MKNYVKIKAEFKPSKFKKFEIDESINGIYKDSFVIPSKNKGYTDNTCYRISVSDQLDLIVNGSGNLNFLMSQVSLGDDIEITYLGKKYVESYSKELHQWELGKAE